MPPHSKCHFTRNCLVIRYFNSGGILSKFVFHFMFTRGSPEHFLESGTDNSNKTARNKVSGKIPPLTTCQIVRKYKEIRHFRSGGIVFAVALVLLYCWQVRYSYDHFVSCFKQLLPPQTLWNRPFLPLQSLPQRDSSVRRLNVGFFISK